MPQLQPERLIQTIAKLQSRVNERFPGSGLLVIVSDLHRISQAAAARAEAIRQPHWPLRLATWLLLAGLVALIGWLAMQVKLEGTDKALDLIQGVEAGMSSLVFLGGAAWFVATLEKRVKRRRALSAMQELRVLAHIIDMHQLTKDPDRLFRQAGENTASSPPAEYTPFQLGRYLDYCSEMLALIGKICLLYGHNNDDEIVLDTIDDVEDLTGNLARKVWQKIVLLNELERTEAGKASAPQPNR